MASSAISDLFSDVFRVIGRWITRHDRAVAVCFIISLIPFLPSLLIVAILTIIHLGLILSGRLDRNNLTIIIFTIGILIFNFILSLLIAIEVLELMLSMLQNFSALQFEFVIKSIKFMKEFLNHFFLWNPLLEHNKDLYQI